MEDSGFQLRKLARSRRPAVSLFLGELHREILSRATAQVKGAVVRCTRTSAASPSAESSCGRIEPAAVSMPDHRACGAACFTRFQPMWGP